MILAKYYYTITKLVLIAISSREPVLILGMCESGKNLGFRLLQESLKKESKKTIDVLLLDLVGITDGTLTINNIQTSKCFTLPLIEFKSYFIENYSDKEVALIINADENDKSNLSVFRSLINLRTTLGQRFNYGIYGYINVYNQLINELKLGEVVSRQIFKVLPLVEKDSLIMIKRQETFFNVQLNSDQKKQVLTLSGGNPGLLKTLVMQISETPNWVEPDIKDEKLIWRIKRLLFGLTPTQISKLQFLSKFTLDDPDYKLLYDFGYIKLNNNQPQIFSPLVATQFTQVDIYNLLTDSEIKIFKTLLASQNKCVTREEIAELIWGGNYLQHYSDYAIDRHISNIRKKLIKYNYPAQIKSLKNRGFLLS